MLEANKELVRRHFDEIWNQRNLGVADALMADDYVEHAVAPFGQAEPGRVNGPAAMRQTAEWLLSQFPDLQMTIEAIVAEGDTVAVRVLSEGTNLGRSTAWYHRRGSGSRPGRPTGSGLRMASWPSTGRPAKTSRRCCSWASCSRQVGRLRRILAATSPAALRRSPPPGRLRLGPARAALPRRHRATA